MADLELTRDDLSVIVQSLRVSEMLSRPITLTARQHLQELADKIGRVLDAPPQPKVGKTTTPCPVPGCVWPRDHNNPAHLRADGSMLLPFQVPASFKPPVPAAFALNAAPKSPATDILAPVPTPLNLDDHRLDAQRYADGLTAMIRAAGVNRRGGSVRHPVFTVSHGRTYDKVVSNNYSAHAFVDHTTGEVYKAESWTKPAKGVRFATVDDALAEAAKNPGDAYTGGYLYRRKT